MTYPSATHPDLTDNLQPAIRAADSDREQAANLLRKHCAEGRIAPDELAERLSRAYRARNLGDLQVLFDDLPANASLLPIKPRRTLSARLLRQLIAIPVVVVVVAVAALAAVTDVHLLWLAWPVLTVYRLHRRPHPGRGVLL